MKNSYRAVEIYKKSDILSNIIGPDSFCNMRKVQYLNTFAAFDIETTAYISNGRKLSTMYMWQVSINHVFIYGRTWEEFINFMVFIRYEYGININRRFIIYVHNLSYEFNWMRKYFEWENVFARQEGEPIRALTKNGFEFRCSYQLAGKSLRALCEEYNLPTKKGELDYGVKRFSWSHIDATTMEYARSDVYAVEEYIKTQIARCGDIAHIPYTRTSYVRQAVKDACYNTNNYKQFIDGLIIVGPENYKSLRRAYQGGFTHANSWRVTKKYENVASYDLTSSYPAVMCSELFPMSTPHHREHLSCDEYLNFIKSHGVIADFEFINLESKTEIENIISKSKCWVLSGAVRAGIKFEGTHVSDNGRLERCDRCCITLTEIDFMLVRKFYLFSKWSVSNAYIYKLGYLPKPIIEVILDAYEKKTVLKNITGAEQDYLIGKEYINAIYGMMVTDVCQDNVKYNPDHSWATETPSTAHSLEKYHASFRRALYYPWGVYVTAYARRNLLNTILQIGSDYIYSDTDSIKLLNRKNHETVFNAYNERIIEKVNTCLTYYNIPTSRAVPCDCIGIPHPLGVWDYEGSYDKFKCMRAKCYLTETNGEIKATIAGCNKQGASEFIAQLDDPFSEFDWNLIIPDTYARRMAALYTNEPTEDTVEDYMGIVGTWKEETSVILIPTEYHLNLVSEFADFLRTFRSLS